MPAADLTAIIDASPNITLIHVTDITGPPATQPAAQAATTERLIDTDPKIVAGRDRTLNLEWTVAIGEEDGGSATQLAVLSVMHTGRKSFAASLNREVLTRRSTGFSSRSSFPFSAVHIATEPAARYSAKGLSAFAAKSLFALRARKDDDAVRAVFGEIEYRS